MNCQETGILLTFYSQYVLAFLYCQDVKWWCSHHLLVVHIAISLLRTGASGRISRAVALPLFMRDRVHMPAIVSCPGSGHKTKPAQKHMRVGLFLSIQVLRAICPAVCAHAIIWCWSSLQPLNFTFPSNLLCESDILGNFCPAVFFSS